MQIGQKTLMVEDQLLATSVYSYRNLVTCRRKKQKIVALSSAKAKSRGIVRGICKVLCIKKLLIELEFSSEETHLR